MIVLGYNKNKSYMMRPKRVVLSRSDPTTDYSNSSNCKARDHYPESTLAFSQCRPVISKVRPSKAA
jgi:hypothetical protein